MKRITLFDIQSYFRRYGWSYEGDGQTYSCTSHSEKVYSIRASVSKTFISFEASLISIPDYCSRYVLQKKLSELLLKANYENSLIKISVSQSGEIVLMIDVLNMGFNYAQFEMIIGIMGYYYDFVFDELHSVLDQVTFHQEQVKTIFYRQR